MSKISYNRKFAAAAAFGATALFSMLSFGNSAEAASVFSCKGTSLKKVVPIAANKLSRKTAVPFG